MSEEQKTENSRVKRLEVQMDLVMDRLAALKEQFVGSDMMYEAVKVYAKRYDQIRDRLATFAFEMEDSLNDLTDAVTTIKDLYTVLRHDLDGLAVEIIGRTGEEETKP